MSKKGSEGHPLCIKLLRGLRMVRGVKLADGVILSGRHAEPLIIPELASFLFIKKC